MPNTPPNGVYTSAVTGDLSSWSGRFTYTDGAIEYTRANDPHHHYRADNTSNGNAMVFSITDGTDTIKFNGPNYKSDPGNKAEYSGNVHKEDPADTPDGWTATQS
jgi:hypothetical protein